MKKLAILLGISVISLFPSNGGAMINVGDEIQAFLEQDTFTIAYKTWKKSTEKELKENSKVIETAYGPIEYSIKLPHERESDSFKPRTDSSSSSLPSHLGPVVLVLHGGFGGYDQGLLVGKHLVSAGYTILCPSRPGYLRTPLSVGKSNSEQADAMIALLDALEIDKVAVLGFSAGAQIAFEFASRHPKRIWALMLESLGAQTSDMPEYQFFTEILELAGSESLDVGSFLFHLFATEKPSKAVGVVVDLDNNLPAKKLEDRKLFVLGNKKQFNFTLDFIRTTEPLSLRKKGIINDIGPNLNPWYSFSYDDMHTPTLLIQAKNDSNGNYQTAKWVAKQIEDAELIKLEESGHFIWLGRETKEWEKKLKEFLRKHDHRHQSHHSGWQDSGQPSQCS